MGSGSLLTCDRWERKEGREGWRCGNDGYFISEENLASLDFSGWSRHHGVIGQAKVILFGDLGNPALPM